MELRRDVRSFFYGQVENSRSSNIYKNKLVVERINYVSLLPKIQKNIFTLANGHKVILANKQNLQ
jgi:hypothetical protein